MQRRSIRLALLVILAWQTESACEAATLWCEICGQPLGDTVYMHKDKVAGDKKGVCAKCELELPNCFLCSLPTLTNAAGAFQFGDGRVLCARDAKNAVLQREDGVRICGEVRAKLERQFSRFLTLPETNVTFAVIDRIDLLHIFKPVGNDYDCPNAWGRTVTTTNAGQVEHRIHVLIGLPSGWFQTTCAHECAHVWLEENLSPGRRKTLGHYAEEGFCELLAFLYADALPDEGAKTNILSNTYSRGQIDLFVKAEQQFGINDVLDWVRHGIDSELRGDDLVRVRAIESDRSVAPTAPSRPVTFTAAPARVPSTLLLKAVFWHPSRPTVLINDKTLGLNEEGKVRVGETNVVIRCLEIEKDSARIEVIGSGEQKVLKLGQAS